MRLYKLFVKVLFLSVICLSIILLNSQLNARATDQYELPLSIFLWCVIFPKMNFFIESLEAKIFSFRCINLMK